MRWRAFTAALVGAALCVGLSTKAFTEDKAAAKPPEVSENQKMLEALATPGEMHAWLGRAAGTWKASGKCWCEGGKASDASGTATKRMTLGGRWLEQVFSGTLENRPFIGYGLIGYDNGKKEFTQIWLDNHSTGATVSTGTLSDDKKTLTFSGTMEMGTVKMPFTDVISIANENHVTHTLTGTMDGKEVPIIELVYERTSSGSGGEGSGGAPAKAAGGTPAGGTRCR